MIPVATKLIRQREIQSIAYAALLKPSARDLQLILNASKLGPLQAA